MRGETTTRAVEEPSELALQQRIDQEHASISEQIIAKSGAWFDVEMDKLDRWAEDRRKSLKVALEDLDAAIKEKKKQARVAPNLPAKLDLQRQLRQLEGKRDEAWKDFDLASRDIEHQKDSLLDEIGQRLNKSTEREVLFTIRWRLA